MRAPEPETAALLPLSHIGLLGQSWPHTLQPPATIPNEQTVPTPDADADAVFDAIFGAALARARTPVEQDFELRPRKALERRPDIDFPLISGLLARPPEDLSTIAGKLISAAVETALSQEKRK
jgi:hypothetical protein